MSGFDLLVASSLENIITKNLGSATMLKIESRLESKYQISLTESINQFQKFDLVLREIFGAGADELEKKFLKSICKIEKSENGTKWCSIEDEMIKKTILEAYGDEDDIKIMNQVNQKSNTISNILSNNKLPQTSGYRKINNLIDSGLLIEDGILISKDKKRITKYRTLFNSVRINIIKNKLNIDIQLKRNDMHNSEIIQTVFNF